MEYGSSEALKYSAVEDYTSIFYAPQKWRLHLMFY